MKFTWYTYKKPIIALAPMANITTLAFRSICREMGADIAYTPMLSSNAIIHNPEKTLEIASFLPHEQPIILQIFGYDGGLIAKAANVAQKALKPAGIDINMGCPAPKITGNECGSALLRDLDKSTKLIETVRDNFDGELSVKLRLGWSEFNILGFVRNLEKIGVNALAIHGRTAKQGYRGKADWDATNIIAESVNIPVIGNGDIKTWQGAGARLRDASLAGVMIGRGALGNPWIFQSIKGCNDVIPTKSDITKIVQLQTERSIKYIGEKQGVLEMRKHLCWYIKKFSGAKNLRKQAVMVETKKDIEHLLVSFN
jgi:nifR3 family TIM-barrel protein